MDLWDAHIHTPFCPHGTSDSLEQYVETAISRGLTGIIFTEHAPLPRSFVDPTPKKDSSMRWDEVEVYLEEVHQLQVRYGDQLTIRAGFEIDYLQGYEQETMEFLQKYEPCLAHSLLSVHFLPLPNREFLCLDYDKRMFGEIVQAYGSVKKVYQVYRDQVQNVLAKPFGRLTPMRLGHLNLVQKFEQAYPLKETKKDTELVEWQSLLDQVQIAGFSLDYNTSGIDKPLYGQTYPSSILVAEAQKRGISLILGSDSHEAKTVGRYFEGKAGKNCSQNE
ncbi:histidinol-phosphatase HisJ [Risungbinella massiliensis]|uniref:histidinol-phosphatase HisJ n=1 Tax=Risungbinella massiliensis TaxID=1329796 RepID=UPI0005CC4D50|nr:histidinol-phosphatase HisJ [Risungbinella massiliensis]